MTKFDITQQQPFTSLLTLFACSIVGCVMLCSGLHGEVVSISADSPLGFYISKFQHGYPILSSVITAATILFSAMWFGRVASMQNLFGRSTSIHLPILGVLYWCVVLNSEYLLSAAILFLMTQAIGTIMLSVRSNNSIPSLFNAAMALSLLPMLYSPAAVLWLSLPLLLISMGVTFREWIVAVIGLVTPFVATIYIYWLCGGEFLDSFVVFYDKLFTDPDWSISDNMLLFRTICFGMAVILSLLSTLWMSDLVHRTRVRLELAVILLVAATTSIIFPSASLLTFCLVAPPVALLTSFTLVRMRGIVANSIYFVLLILLLLALFTPIYIPIDVVTQNVRDFFSV